MISRMLRLAPLAAAGLVWAVATMLLAVNLLLPVLGRSSMKLFPSLTGATLTESLDWSWEGVLHGNSQAAYARVIGTRMPLYPAAVRLRNEVQFALFGISGVPGLLVGRDQRLFETAYSEEYCKRGLAPWRGAALRWAEQIREMQTIQERRGKAFLYELTPSKVAQYPGILPAGYSCPANAGDPAGVVREWLDTLRTLGVNVVDTTAVLAAARQDYPFALYPPGGAHWNAVGSALAMQAVTSALGQLRPAAGFVPFTFTWHMIRHAFGLDVDLGRLMNLMWGYPAGPVPQVDLQPGPAPQPCPDVRVVIVGGSFSHALLESLLRTTCNPPAIEYEYWRVFRLFWTPAGPKVTPGVDEAERARDIMGADVLVYEENEQVLFHPPQGQALWEFLHAL